MNLINLIKICLGLFFFALSFISCKKESTTGENCSCPSSGTPEQVNHMYNIVGNGFFVFNRFYSIDNNDNVVLDSCLSHATQSFAGQQYPGKALGPVYYSADSAKVNGVRFIGGYISAGYGVGYSDLTNTNFSPPRVCEYYGDSTKMFVSYTYTDNTQLPQYLGAASLPDSININNDYMLLVGERKNMMNTEVAIKQYLTDPSWAGFDTEIISTDQFVTIPKQKLTDLGPGYVYIRLNVRNWTTTIMKKQRFYFVSDHRYIKKIKLYN